MPRRSDRLVIGPLHSCVLHDGNDARRYHAKHMMRQGYVEKQMMNDVVPDANAAQDGLMLRQGREVSLWLEQEEWWGEVAPKKMKRMWWCANKKNGVGWSRGGGGGLVQEKMMVTRTCWSQRAIDDKIVDAQVMITKRIWFKSLMMIQRCCSRKKCCAKSINKEQMHQTRKEDWSQPD